MTQPLYPWHPLDRRLGEPQSQSGRSGEEKNLAPDKIRTLVIQPVARHCTNELTQIHTISNKIYDEVYGIQRKRSFMASCRVCFVTGTFR
jgi:hypothetical protein